LNRIFKKTPCFERLPGANGRKDSLRIQIKRQTRSSKTENENAQETSTAFPKFGKHNQGQMAY